MHCDAGWRPWTFVKITTDKDIVGYSEITDSHGSPRGLSGIVEDLAPLLIGEDPRAIEKIRWTLYRATRQNPGGLIQKAMGGIENALIDIKAKALGIPVYEMFGGPTRNRMKAYWSHCGTTRARAWKVTGTPKLSSYADVTALGKEVKSKGFGILKTNIVFPGEQPTVYMPGFKDDFDNNIKPTSAIIEGLEKLIEAFRAGTGDKVDIILDLNFNFKTKGNIKIAKAMEPYHLMWLEIDAYDPAALAHVKSSTSRGIATGENLYTSRQYLPFLQLHAMDIAIVDVIWNGFTESKRIADLADIYEMSVAPHNYYSHLSSFISAHFCASISNSHLLELDIDDVPWKDELVTVKPEIKDGCMILPKGVGWGTDLNENAIKEHPWPK
jgi:L-alanine-DL-glutamate epimerase-like enolase superfamily enzyme